MISSHGSSGIFVLVAIFCSVCVSSAVVMGIGKRKVGCVCTCLCIVLCFGMDLGMLDKVVRYMCREAVRTNDDAIDKFLANLDMLHTMVTLSQQELTDLANGDVVFSEKYLAR